MNLLKSIIILSILTVMVSCSSKNTKATPKPTEPPIKDEPCLYALWEVRKDGLEFYGTVRCDYWITGGKSSDSEGRIFFILKHQK